MLTENWHICIDFMDFYYESMLKTNKRKNNKRKNY